MAQVVVSDIRTGRHVKHSLLVALTFMTKSRSVVFDETRLRAIFEDVCEDFNSHLVEMSAAPAGEVQLLVQYPPKHSVAALVNSLKGVSSRVLRTERADIRRQCVKGSLWSPNYQARSIGI
jgi:putative transposase